MRLFMLLFLILLPMTAMSYEEKSDDHNFLKLGVISRKDILDGRKIYNQNYVDYVPKSDPVQAIHNCSQPVEIKVIFGDWCKDSKKHVPAFIKTMEFADNKAIQIVYINVDRQKKEPADLLQSLDIQSVPTFIVYSQGKEIGRVVESPKA
ncbi:MAG TPA: thioredoxin family protein, partial [Acidobacteriota bacterium]